MFVREMIAQAIDELGGRASRQELVRFIMDKHPDLSENTVTTQISICSVNMRSRVYYPENRKPRLCNDPRYDLLYSVARGEYLKYRPEEHGLWQIAESEDGLIVCPVVDDVDPVNPVDEVAIELGSAAFALEAHLRDFLAKNLPAEVVPGLALYKDENGRIGIEYPTDVGPVDILAVDRQGNFYVFELKVSRGADAACGQVLRYMGWIRRHLANGKKVQGIVVAKEISKQLAYAIDAAPDVQAFTYHLSFRLQQQTLDVGAGQIDQ